MDPATRCIATVRFAGDARRAHAVLRENPELERTIREGIRHHGLIRSTRLVAHDGYLDIDEWRHQDDRDAFVVAMAPHIRRWSELAGVTHIESRLWRPAAAGEEL
jgi:hypothetical protein